MLTRRGVVKGSAAVASMTLVKAAFAIEKPPRFIADAWYAHTAFLVLLGAQERLVATVARPDVTPWMFRLLPRLSSLLHVHPRSINAEALLTVNTDLLILPHTGAEAVAAFEQHGVHAVAMGFSDFDGLCQCVMETASLLQTSVAHERARAYVNALRHELSLHTASRNGPRVLHMASLRPLKVDGGNTIIDQWIRASGGVNAASAVRGNHCDVDAEQIVTWDPDIIIIPASEAEHDVFYTHPVLSHLRVVRQKRIHCNPAGLFMWDRYGPELLLQLQWARQIITAGYVDEDAMRDRIVAFYRDFYSLHVSHLEAGRMLAALPPAGAG